MTFEAVHACFGPPIITDFELATIWEREAHSTTISKKGRRPKPTPLISKRGCLGWQSVQEI